MAYPYRNDPYFTTFATLMAKIVKEAQIGKSALEPELRPGLIERALAGYTNPNEHPLVILAKQAQNANCARAFRVKVAEMLKSEAKTAAQKNGVKFALAVYDAALNTDTIALRAAVKEVGRVLRPEWTEAV